MQDSGGQNVGMGIIKNIRIKSSPDSGLDFFGQGSGRLGFIGQGQPSQAFDEKDAAIEEIDEAPDEHGRHQRADAKASQGPQAAIKGRQDDGNGDHGRIEGDFRRAHPPFPRLGNGLDGPVARHHQDLRRHFDADAEGQGRTAGH